jgi:uncharacterized damage-inducible protein DinB
MSRIQHVRLMATYNEWMNSSLYEAAMKLSDDELAADRKAFFGSILGTLNHIVVADRIWLGRFMSHPANHAALLPVREYPAPVSLDEVLYTDIRSLAAHRRVLDDIILAWAMAVTETDLDQTLHYTNMKGVASERNFFSLLMHFFNHQTHHRGQATTLLFQAGIDVGITDLLVNIPDQMR